MKAYKVCKVNSGGQYVSAITHHLTARQPVVYRMGEEIKPREDSNPFLFVFASEGEACRFLLRRNRRSRFVILEVAAKRVRHTAKTRDGCYTYESKSYPVGTRFCSSLTVVRSLGTFYGGSK